MIFPLKRNFRDKIFEVSQDFSRGACEGPKFSRLKFSRPDKNPLNPRKFSPSKILGYTVIQMFNCSFTLFVPAMCGISEVTFVVIYSPDVFHEISESMHGLVTSPLDVTHWTGLCHGLSSRSRVPCVGTSHALSLVA